MRIAVVVGALLVFAGGLWLRLAVLPVAAHAVAEAGVLPDDVSGFVLVLIAAAAALPGALVLLALLHHARRPSFPRAAVAYGAVLLAGLLQFTAPALGRLGTQGATSGVPGLFVDAGIDPAWATPIAVALSIGGYLALGLALTGAVRWYLIRPKPADTLVP